jgi:hypothetical protein
MAQAWHHFGTTASHDGSQWRQAPATHGTIADVSRETFLTKRPDLQK